jgi:hypothetical protein
MFGAIATVRFIMADIFETILIGWLSGITAYVLLPESGLKILLSFLVGFLAAWIIRTA